VCVCVCPNISMASSIVFCLKQHGTYDADIAIFDTDNRAWIFDKTFVYDTVHVYVPCKNFKYLDKIAPNFNTM
jgi:hypothetical protein